MDGWIFFTSFDEDGSVATKLSSAVKLSFPLFQTLSARSAQPLLRIQPLAILHTCLVPPHDSDLDSTIRMQIPPRNQPNVIAPLASAIILRVSYALML